MAGSSAELAQLVERYHHLQNEHRQAGIEGSVRRHMQAELEELERKIESLLTTEVSEESEREAWRMRIHHGYPAPSLALSQPLVFRGRSEAGSLVEIRARPDGDCDVLIDGALAERLGGPIDFDRYRMGDREYAETFEVPAAALEALRTWVHDPSGDPPREYEYELIEDGLVDRYFGLTARGRRAVAAG